VLAASQTDGFSVPLLVAAAAVTLAWWLVLGTVGALRRPPRIAGKGGAALEPPSEPPAVAGILAGDFEVAKETAPAVLVDLAARGFVALDEVQPGRTVCRLRQGGDGPITDYEDRVLTELRTKAVDGVVPADALTTGPELQSKGWHRAFAKEVIADAQSRGLTSPRWPLRLNAVLGLGLGAIVVLLFVAAQVGGDADDDGTLLGAIAAAVAIGGLVGGGVVVSRLGASLAQLPTPAGRAAAARCVDLATTLRENEAVGDLPPAGVHLWDRLFAYAAVFGAAPRAVGLLPMGAEDDHRAWSRVGGRWRRVRVRYPRARPPAWGKHPVLALGLALFWAAVAALVGYGLLQLAGSDRPKEISVSAWTWVERGTIFGLVPVILAIAWAAWIVFNAVPDCWQRRTVVGDIVRDRRYRQWFSSGDDPDYWYYLAVDDGTQDKIAAWRVRESLWEQRSQGETVQAELTPRLGYVRSISPR
jgi:Predicted membrane protein (DUF2207) C-terminal domain